MAFEDSLARVYAWLDSNDTDVILSGEGDEEIRAVWSQGQPVDPLNATIEEMNRLGSATHVVGWFHFMRYIYSRDKRDPDDLVIALVSLRKLINQTDNIPPYVLSLFGSNPNEASRVELGWHLVEHSADSSQPATLELGMELLGSTNSQVDGDAMFVLSRSMDTYHHRFLETGDVGDLIKAVVVGEKIWSTNLDHRSRVKLASNLAVMHQELFGQQGVVAHLDRVVTIGELTLPEIRDHDMVSAELMLCIGVAHHSLFELFNRNKDLDRAIILFEQVGTVCNVRDECRLSALSNLSNCFRDKALRKSDPTLLKLAESAAQKAIDDISETHPLRSSFLLAMANVELAKFDLNGQVADLDRGIKMLGNIAARDIENDPAFGVIMSNMGGAYWRRFQWQGNSDDLNSSIAAVQKAVDALPAGKYERAVHLSRLGMAYYIRYERNRVPKDLNLAIDKLSECLAAAGDQGVVLIAWLSELAGAYRARFYHDRNIDDLARALDIGERSIGASTADQELKGFALNNLGATYVAKYQISEDPDDLDRAIALYESAIKMAGESLDYIQWLSNLMRAYRVRLQACNLDRLTELVKLVEVHYSAVSPVMRVRINREAGLLASRLGQNDLAVRLLDRAVGELPSVVSHQGNRTDREHRFGEHAGLVSEAVAAHCATDDARGAVEVAELGRGIQLAEQTGADIDLQKLRLAEPELAAQLTQCRTQLNGFPTPRPWRDEQARPNGPELRDEHDRLLAAIRQNPNFRKFQLRPNLDAISPEAGEAVILVNVGTRRADGIIITSDATPTLIPLPRLTWNAAQEHAAKLWSATHDDGIGTTSDTVDTVVTEVLAWLWDTVVEPLLRDLPARRVWWMPVGQMSLFPLHAAGHIGETGALDHAISSYTPTLRTLAHARSRPRTDNRRQLVVAYEQHIDDKTMLEATELHSIRPDMPMLAGEQATAASVLAALPNATWVHFACHAALHLSSPSSGGLELRDGMLSIARIGELSLAAAEFAYLSACDAAATSPAHADECIHLTAMFQLIGFRHVVGTLWPLNSDAAVVVARAFYHEQALEHADHTAISLHEVVRSMRKVYPDQPSWWAALVHSGPGQSS